MRTEGLDHLNISKDSIGNEPGAYRFVAVPRPTAALLVHGLQTV
jgi:hypothetical protein